MMMHGLGDCTPELNCGCMAKPPDVLRERIARALWRHRYPGVEQAGPLADLALTDADAVIAALGMEEDTERRRVAKWTDGRRWDDAYEARRYVTPWERIEEGK